MIGSTPAGTSRARSSCSASADWGSGGSSISASFSPAVCAIGEPLRGYVHDKEIAWIATGFTLIVAYSMQVDELVTTLLGVLF